MNKNQECFVGYLAAPPEQPPYVLISVNNPSLSSASDRDFVQVALTVEGARELHAHLTAFLREIGAVSH